MRSAFGLVAAAALLAAGGSFAGDRPVFTVGMVTDTHVRKEKSSCARVKAAFTLFREHKVDIVFHTGDLAHKYGFEAWRNWRETVEEIYPDAASRPRIVYAAAGHDHSGAPKGKTYDETCVSAYREMLKTVGADQELCAAIEFRGYAIIAVPEYGRNEKEIEGLLRDACARHPDRPVFVLDHEPGLDTTTNSRLWGRPSARALYDRYPQVVHFSGHTHTAIRSERNIWQGGHTAVDLACMNTWTERQDGLRSKMTPESGATLMEVYPDRLVFRRYDLLNGEEVRPDERWTVPLPFDPKTAPYREEARTARDTAPALTGCVKGVELPARAMQAVFPAARHRHGIWRYECELQRAETNGDWRTLARLRPLGDFHLPETKRAAEVSVPFTRGYFAEGGRYRFAVRAQAFTSLRSETVHSEVFSLPPDPELKTLWSSDRVWNLLDQKRCSVEIPLPDDVNRLPKGTKLVLSADFLTQSALGNLMPIGTTGRKDEHYYAWSSPPENAEIPLRVSFDFTKHADEERLALVCTRGRCISATATNLTVQLVMPAEK